MLLYTHTVPSGTECRRMDSYLAEIFPCFPSRKSAKKAIASGAVFVDGTVPDPQSVPAEGQVIEVHGTASPVHREFALPMKVIYEDRWFAVVEKPAGVPVNGNMHRTVEHALPGVLSPSEEPDALDFPRPVHRLDRATGGLLIAAKTATAMVALGRQFQERKVKKTYRALVTGKLEGSGYVDQPVEGRPARSLYTARFHIPSLKSGYITCLDLSLKPGGPIS